MIGRKGCSNAGSLLRLCAVLFVFMAQSALGFKVTSHAAVGNRALDELLNSMYATDAVDRDSLFFPRIRLDISSRSAYDTIDRYPDYFRMGTTGPDAFPDLVSGQLQLHPNLGEPNGIRANMPLEQRAKPSWYRSIDFAVQLLRSANDRGDGKAISFALGYFSHCVADGFSHTYINEATLGAWNYLEGTGIYGELTEEIKHVALEGIIDRHVPNNLKNTGDNQTFNRMNVQSPVDFLDDFFNTRFSQAGLDEFMGGRLYNYFDIQGDFIEGTEQVLNVPLTALETSGRILPMTASGLINLAQEIPLVGDLIEAVADLIIERILDRYNPVTLYASDVRENFDDLKKTNDAFRRNWILLSERTMQNLVKGEAAGTTDAALDALSRIDLKGVDGPEAQLLRDKFEELFATPKDSQNQPEDHRKISVNAQRSAKYLLESFLLDDLENTLVPAELVLMWEQMKAWLQDPANKAFVNTLLLGPAKALASVGCATEAGTCLVKAAGSQALCEGSCVLDAGRSFASCLVNGSAQCWRDNTVVISLTVPYLSCSWNGWRPSCRLRTRVVGSQSVPTLLFPFCIAGNTVQCTATRGAQLAGCTGRCIETALLANARCAEQLGKCALEVVTEVDALAQIEKAVDRILLPLREVKEVVKTQLIRLGCSTAEGLGLPVKTLQVYGNLYQSFESSDEGHPFLLMNMAFLREDLQDADWSALVMGNAETQQTRDFLEALKTGTLLQFLQEADNNLGSLESPRGKHCLDFNVEEGGFSGDSRFRELLRNNALLNEPGPTARRVLNDLGTDFAASFLPFKNAVQATKLIPVNSQADIESFFAQAGIPDQTDLLPWRIATGSDHSQYSAIARDSKYTNIYIDAVASLDDPNCFGCVEKPIGDPPDSRDLIGNLEKDATIEGWLRKRGVVVWNNDGPPSVTSFLLATKPTVRAGLYDKIFTYPGNITRPVIPILNSVCQNSDESKTARFGYENPNPFPVTIDIGERNRMEGTGINEDEGQPVTFEPGVHNNVVTVRFGFFGRGGLTWTLDGTTIPAFRPIIEPCFFGIP